MPGRFLEVARFERPLHSQHKRQHADIVCGVEFSPDGNLLACAGVAKQACNAATTLLHSCCPSMHIFPCCGMYLPDSVFFCHVPPHVSLSIHFFFVMYAREGKQSLTARRMEEKELTKGIDTLVADPSVPAGGRAHG